MGHDIKPQNERKNENRRKTSPPPGMDRCPVRSPGSWTLFRVFATRKAAWPAVPCRVTWRLEISPTRFHPLTSLKTLSEQENFFSQENWRLYEFMLEVNFLISSLSKYQGIYFSYVISRESALWPDFYSVGLLRDLTVKRSPVVRTYPRTDIWLQRNLTIPGRKRVKSQ